MGIENEMVCRVRFELFSTFISYSRKGVKKKTLIRWFVFFLMSGCGAFGV